MHPSLRLRIATRIHFGLLRHFDEKVDVETLLRGGQEAREALWVCDASDDPELMLLAKVLRGDVEVPKDANWSRGSTGFGTTGFGVTGFGTSFGSFAPTGFGDTGIGELAEAAPQATAVGEPRPSR